MSDERRRIDAVFAEALDYVGEDQKRFLDAACRGDDALRKQVEQLLQAADTRRGLLGDDEAPGIPLESLEEIASREGMIGNTDQESSGDRIGPFELRSIIGKGGMGVVWRASRVDGGFEQDVALKLVRGPSSGDLARRFLRERQILAGLEHPGIARLVDGGVDGEGRPWFALELVSGEALLDYCRERQLELPVRLELFEQIARAVDYAHRHLLVHRDIKPGNVMVTADGQIKLLDFGIAKLLDESSEASHLTMTRMNPMTPKYASPEQLLGDGITTASDVYQLGVLLYELITERAPFEASTMAPSQLVDAARARRSLQPARVASIPADVDAIVMMATRPEPERRYDSAGLLADDVRAFLRGRPVEAQGDSMAYRARRFAGRHKLGVTASAIAVAAAVGLTVAVAWGYVNAERERQRAAAISQFLEDTLRAANPFIAQGRDTALLEDIIDQAADRIDTELADQPYAAANVHLTIADTLHTLSDYDRAAFHAATAARGFDHRLGPDARETLEARLLEGLLAWEVGRNEDAERILEDGLTRARRELGMQDALTQSFVTDLGLAIRAQGRLDEAEPYYRESVALREQSFGNADERTIAAISNLAFLLAELDRLEEAERYAREAAELSRAHLGDDHADTWLNVDKFAAVLGKRGRLEEALALHREAADGLLRLLGERHSTTLGSIYSGASVLRKLERYDEAIVALEGVARVVREEFGPRSRFMYPTLRELSLSMLASGRAEDALPIVEEARDIAGELLGESHHDYAYLSIQLADAELETGNNSDTPQLLRDARRVLEASFGPESNHRYFEELVRVEAKAAAVRPAATGPDT